jgi:hypothetical protein
LWRGVLPLESSVRRREEIFRGEVRRGRRRGKRGSEGLWRMLNIIESVNSDSVGRVVKVGGGYFLGRDL